MRPYATLMLLSCLALPLLAQEPAKIIIKTDETVNPWNHLQVNNRAETFQFAIVTDRTGGHREGVFEDGVTKLNLLQPEFVMSVGDLIEGYTRNEDQIDREWEEFTGFISRLQMPFFYVPGNHDYINEVMARKWKERFGRDYYHFVYKDVLFLCVNSEERMTGAGRGYIGDAQHDYIAQALRDNPQVKWTLLFMHQPLWNQTNTGRWADVEALLASRKHTVFVGHNHQYVKYERNNGKYFILATTGGGSRLRGPQFGEFDHVVWITMTPDGPIMANLLLEGIWDENINTEKQAAFTQPLIEGRAVRVEPLILDKPEFQGGEVIVRVTNDSDVPMRARLDLSSTAQIWVQNTRFDEVIAPNSVELVTFRLRTGKPVKADALTALALKTTLSYSPENRPLLEIQSEYQLRPEYRRPVSKAPALVAVDGDPAEWKNLRYTATDPAQAQGSPFAHKGAADGSFTFDLAADDQFVYMCVAVTDDEVSVTDGNNPLSQDGIGIQLDARPATESTNSNGEGYMKNYALILISPLESGTGAGNVFMPEALPPGTQTACRRTATGYVVEAAIPIAYLDKMQGKTWESFRFNIGMSDIDNQGAHTTVISWQPDWRSAANILGSGMFRK
ncbi:MAG: sugar-binding protein [Bacteroidia bacterium]|nr:sugar-binding protein [Bacteroidia bacterium]